MKRLILISIFLLAFLLRFYDLAGNPPSLYWDEASLGYNAYSILKTARDEFGTFLPLTNFPAFGDYKPPGYIYADVAPIAVLGLNELAIRFPSALAGTLTIFAVYLLAKKIFKNEKIALFATFFLAVSPWHLQLSRAAFEANLALLFSTLGILFFLSVEKKPYLIVLSAISFILAMYTFTGQRLFVPFILLILLFQFRNQIITNWKITFLAGLLGLILFLPLLKFTAQTIEGKLRFNEVTIFKDLKPIDDSIRFREEDNFSLVANIIHNRRFFFVHEYLTHYFDAFNPSFLFVKGDVNPRLSIQEIGELYYFDALLVPLGIFLLLYRKQKYRFLVIGWLLVSPLGPATARETPHALRMIHILPTYLLISSYGAYNLIKNLKFNKIFIAALCAALLINFLYYLHMYYIHWPLNYSGDWQYGYKQAVDVAKTYYSQVDQIIVTKSMGRPYIYFLFYTNYDPEIYQQTAKVTRDQFYFLDVEGFDKFKFTDSPSTASLKGKTLFIVRPDDLPDDATKVTSVNNLIGESVFDIGIASR